ncbi:MAG: hypothetical protein ACHP78_12920 [Terriglobales bacterium]
MAGVADPERARKKEEVAMSQKDQEKEEFARKLAATVKKELKPDFDRIDSRFDQVDKAVAGLQTSNSDIQQKLSTIINKLG